MANVTNNEAIRFCDEYARVAADKLAQAYEFARLTLDVWYANNYGAIITAGDDIEDGAYGTDGTDGDGRKVISGNDVTNVVVRCSEFVADIEASSNAKLNTLLGVAVNPKG